MATLSKAEKRLQELEKQIKARGVQLAYERLQFAGLALKSGLCWFKGRYYLFVDRRKTVSQRRDLLEGALDEMDSLTAQGRLGQPDAPVDGEVEAPASSEPETPETDAPRTEEQES